MKTVKVLRRTSKFNNVAIILCYIRCHMRFESTHLTRTRTKHKSFTHRFFLDKFKIREHSLSFRFQTRRFKTNILHVTVSYIAETYLLQSSNIKVRRFYKRYFLYLILYIYYKTTRNSWLTFYKALHNVNRKCFITTTGSFSMFVTKFGSFRLWCGD